MVTETIKEEAVQHLSHIDDWIEDGITNCALDICKILWNIKYNRFSYNVEIRNYTEYDARQSINKW